MHPATRTQVDGKGEEYSRRAVIDCSTMADTARQEFKREADTNWILSRFGVKGALQRQASFGENDFNLDLQGAYVAREEAQRALWHLPPELREKYKTTKAMLDAMNTGELLRDLQAHRDAAEAPPPAPPAPPEATP